MTLAPGHTDYTELQNGFMWLALGHINCSIPFLSPLLILSLDKLEKQNKNSEVKVRRANIALNKWQQASATCQVLCKH